MPYYRVCFLDKGRTVCFDEFSADDDIDAIREAQKHVTVGKAELRCGGRRVTEINAKEGQPALGI